MDWNLFLHTFCNCSWTKFIANIVNVMVVLWNFFAGPFCDFLLEHSLTSQVTFSRFRSSFLTDLYCPQSEVKLVANVKSVAAYKKQGSIAEWSVQLIMDREFSGQKLYLGIWVEHFVNQIGMISGAPNGFQSWKKVLQKKTYESKLSAKRKHQYYSSVYY